MSLYRSLSQTRQETSLHPFPNTEVMLSYFSASIFGAIPVIHNTLCKGRASKLAKYNPYYTEKFVSYCLQRLSFVMPHTGMSLIQWGSWGS